MSDMYINYYYTYSQYGRQVVRRIMSLILLLLSVTAVYAQDIVEVAGEYTYVTSSEKSVAEAKRVAQERAKLQALADRFGTTIRQQNSTHITNSNSSSTLDFFSIGNSEVKGEWIADVKNPIYDISFSDNNLIVKVNVWGKAREIVSASIDINALLLRNGKESKYESDVFRNGDDIYLQFRAPIDGYLAVYLVDEESTAYRLLPYSGVNAGAQIVEAGKDYIFFDTECAPTEQERTIIDELTITTNKGVEHNEVFILFSATPFVKPNDSKTDELIPKSLKADTFQKWLAKNRTKDSGMVVVNKLIKITQN